MMMSPTMGLRWRLVMTIISLTKVLKSASSVSSAPIAFPATMTESRLYGWPASPPLR